MKKIDISTPSNQNICVLVDDDDYDRVIGEGKWRIYGNHVIRRPYVPKGGTKYLIYLDQFIMKTDYFLKHKDGDLFNYQKSNLEINYEKFLINNNVYITKKTILEKLDRMTSYAEKETVLVKNNLEKIFEYIEELILIFMGYGINIDLKIGFNVEIDNFIDLDDMNTKYFFNKENYNGLKILDEIKNQRIKMDLDLDYCLTDIKKIIYRLKDVICGNISFLYLLINYIMIFKQSEDYIRFIKDKNFNGFSRDKRNPYSHVNDNIFKNDGKRKMWLKKEE